MGSRKGNRDVGGTKRGGKRRSAVSQTVDAGDEQPVTGREQKNQKHCKKKKNRRNKGEDSDDDEDIKLRRYLEEEGLELLEMNADGNCLFRSLSDQLCGDFGSKHRIIRESVCKFMEENKEDYEVFLVYEDENDHDQQDEDARDFEHYIEQMRSDGEWGGHLELTAAARLFRRNIRVYQANKTFYTIPYDGPKTRGTDMLVSFHDENHYNSVRDPRSPPSKDYLKKLLAQMASSGEDDEDNDSTSRDSDSTSKDEKRSLDPPEKHAPTVESLVPEYSVHTDMEKLSLRDNISKKSKHVSRRHEKQKSKKNQSDKDDKEPQQQEAAPKEGRGFQEIRI
ncbi:OTU-like cysteine protease [Nitzschia inconspicua]|uniref:OTU-like cysteine protease n=1 Tax=Nitzschia inconspicua TaxID=303405 RepID=A0A9K3KLU9_9STRA|nr:OTU-like cysteine protease [Nitzschia inconspicua]